MMSFGRFLSWPAWQGRNNTYWVAIAMETVPSTEYFGAKAELARFGE